MPMYALQYAVLGLISAREAGVHGYKLKNEFEALYGDFWVLNYGQMYRTLDRLERAGLIEGFDEFQTGRPNRKVFRITRQGRDQLLEERRQWQAVDAALRGLWRMHVTGVPASATPLLQGA